VERLVRILSVSMLACTLVASQSDTSPVAALTAPATYLVVYRQPAVAADASARVASAGGALVRAYAEIGVLIATSSDPQFRERIIRDPRIQDARVSAPAGVRLKLPRTVTADAGVPAPSALAAPLTAPLRDSAGDLTANQWDMRQIRAFEAHRATRGSPSVLVADIDTGVDYKHPDLKANIDFADSTSCIGGVPDPRPVAWSDGLGHGTHTAGTIAALGTGGGIIGVAPNVRLAIIKAGNDDGFFYPEAVVCAFVWAATHGVDIANNSYFGDPFYFNCPNDPVQNVILVAEQRAIAFAQSRGVSVVASVDNFSDDLANPTQDRHSPTDATPVVRAVDRSCRILPAEAPGVIAVSSTGAQGLKAATSNYGFGIVDLAAPGGDSRLQPTPDGGGRVLSTWPASLMSACPRLVTLLTNDPDEPQAAYCYQQGTSMAAAHVSGVAALILSRQRQSGSGQSLVLGNVVQSLLYATADPIACPTPDVLALYAPFPSLDNDAPQTCQARAAYNGWYGYGQVDALSAVRAASVFGNGHD
jgi:subtilisin family serine protease